MTTKNIQNMTKAELAARLLELEAKLAEQEQGQSQQAPAQTPIQGIPNVTFTVPSTDVNVVYCSDSLGYAKISNMELHFNKYGEEFTLSRSQFDELVGKYRSWFDSGILAVSYKNVDVAAAKGLRTDRDNILDASILNKIGTMSAQEIESLWDELDLPAQKESIVSYYKHKFIEGDPNFVNREKVDLLNRLTKGGFRREQDELSGRYKIAPTEM